MRRTDGKKEREWHNLIPWLFEHWMSPNKNEQQTMDEIDSSRNILFSIIFGIPLYRMYTYRLPCSKFHTTFFAGLCVSDKHQKLLHFEQDFSFNVTLFLCFSRRASQTKTVSYLMESFAKFFGISKKWELRGVKKQLSNENETDRLRSYFHFLFLVCK